MFFGYFETETIIYSTNINIILSWMIILRLIHHQRHMRKALAVEHGFPYSKVIAMFVESSALIVIFSAIYIALVLTGVDGAVILFTILPHICVGGLSGACLKIFIPNTIPGYLASPHCLSCCRRSCHVHNFTTIRSRASNSGNSVQ